MTEVEVDKLAHHSGATPDVQLLLEEYDNAWTQDRAGIEWISRAEDVRYARWAGQTYDGKKHAEAMPEGRPALPYENAPDCRIHLVDDAINGLVDLLFASFWGARTQVTPLHGSRLTAQQCAELRSVVKWITGGVLRAKLIDEVELTAQLAHTLGHVLLHPCWKRTMTLRTETLTLEQIMAAAQQPIEGGGPNPLAQLPVILLDPTLEDQAVAVLQSAYPDLKRGQARKIARELRETGTTEFPVPTEGENQPDIHCLIPWVDVVLPVETTCLQDARAIFRRVWLTEAQLVSMIVEDDWDEDFVEAAKQTAGLSSELRGERVRLDENERLIEIVHSYVRAVDENGVPAIYCTIFSPHLGHKSHGGDIPYAKHYLLDYAHGQYPFLVYRTEVIGRRPSDARGVPDVLNTAQNELKKQRDALYVFSELSVTPPLKKIGARGSKLPPEFGPIGIFHENTPGEWQWFQPPPGKPDIAFKLIEDIRREKDEYFGFLRADGHPSRGLARQQRLVNRWLLGWSQALWQLAVLTYQNLSSEQLALIIGRVPTVDVATLRTQGLQLTFDVRALDNEWVKEMLATINQFVLPADTGGVVDRSKLVQFALSYLDPTLGDEIALDQTGAAQAVFEKVRDDVAQMALGNEAMYVENDPTAKMKLQFLQQIIAANPKYQQALQSDQRFVQLLQTYAKNLEQSVVQEENKLVGRLGVKPGEV